jgi:restriction system protein
MLTLLFVLIALVAARLFLTMRPTARARRHQRNRNAARRVLARIQSLERWPQRLAYPRKIDPFTFEELLLDAFECSGYRVCRNRRYTGDGGIDGTLKRHGQIYLIQVKRYRGYINRQDVANFCRLLEQRHCQGFLCHTGRTGAAVHRLAERHPRMTIVSGQRLLDLLAPPRRRENEL